MMATEEKELWEVCHESSFIFIIECNINRINFLYNDRKNQAVTQPSHTHTHILYEPQAIQHSFRSYCFQ